LAIHVYEKSELLRKEFVSCEGKKEIIVEKEEFKMGANNNWTTTWRILRKDKRKHKCRY